jgi:hypothetical protein
MLTNLNSLFNKHVQVLRDLGGKTVGLEDADNLLASDGLDLGDTIGVTKDDTNLRGGQTLLGKLADVVLNISGRDLQPSRRRALVWEGSLGDTLSWCMHTTHAVISKNNGSKRGRKWMSDIGSDNGNCRGAPMDHVK